MKPIQIHPKIDLKGWGREIILTNSADYCGKILEFDLGGRTSLHAHSKREHFLVEGSFLLEYIDTDKAEKKYINLKTGDVFFIPPMMPHAIVARTKGRIIEFSTQHIESEVFRYEKGDSQKNNLTFRADCDTLLT